MMISSSSAMLTNQCSVSALSSKISPVFQVFLFWMSKMGKKISLSEIQRAQVLILHKERLLERNICNNVSYSKTAVHQVIVKFKNSGNYVNKKQRSIPQKMTCHDDNFIWWIAVQSLTCSCKKICSALLQRYKC